jgi:tetratricopeptide (TPR) repeat protein
MKGYRQAVALAAMAMLLGGYPAAAQDWKGKGTISGLVTDVAGAPVAGASVRLHLGEDTSAGPEAVITDKDGRWQIEKLTFGTWKLEITAPNFDVLAGEVPLTKEQPKQSITVKLAPEDIAARAIDAGNKLFNQHKWAEARIEYEKALAALSPEQQATNKRGLLLMIAQIDVRMKQAPKAIETVQVLVAEKPDDHEALRILAQAQREAGQKDAAIESLKKVAGLVPQDAAVYDFLIEWMVEAKRTAEAEEYLAKAPGKIDPVTLLNLGIQYFNDKKYPEAVAKFDAVVAADPKRTDVLYFRGLANMEQKKHAEAKADFEKVAADPAAPKAGDARLKLAIIDYEAKDYTGAVTKLDALAGEMPQRGEVFYFRGYAKLAQKKNSEAKADLQKFLSLAPGDPRVAEVQGLIKKL